MLFQNILSKIFRLTFLKRGKNLTFPNKLFMEPE